MRGSCAQGLPLGADRRGAVPGRASRVYFFVAARLERTAQWRQLAGLHAGHHQRGLIVWLALPGHPQAGDHARATIR